MTLVPIRNNLFNSFVDDVENHWNKLIDNFFSPNSINDLRKQTQKTGNYPRWDVFTHNGNYVIQAAIPGMTSKDIVVETFDKDDVTYVRVSGQMSEEYRYKNEDCSWSSKELHRRSFYRVEPLPNDLRGDPEAKIKDGMLTLSWKLPQLIPKQTDVKRIEVKD